jgi:glycosyltransferase involved in cell wall biosynthesis
VETSPFVFLPRLSLVVPCYNEEACLRQTACELVEAFTARGIPLQLVLVDNGSRDDTGRVIDELIARGLPVTKAVVPINRGYGRGILEGLKLCVAPLVGFICADGQVAASSTVEAYCLACAANGPTLTKVRRRIRQDSWKRKLISVAYNLGMQLVFGWLASLDLNGNPKILPREHVLAMALQSKDWFLDAELMIKSKHLGLRVIEFDVTGQLRRAGKSKVRLFTCWEFLKNMWRFRFGRELRQWKRLVEQGEIAAQNYSPTTVGGNLPE